MTLHRVFVPMTDEERSALVDAAQLSMREPQQHARFILRSVLMSKHSTEMRKSSRTYRVVSIAKDIRSYPECAADTAAFPHLVKHLENEQELFIIEADDPSVFYPASEFFYILSGMVECATFTLMVEDKS